MFRLKQLLPLLIILSTNSYTFYINLLSPYDTLIRSRYDLGYRVNLTAMGEYGFKPIVFNNKGTIDSPLHIWQPDINGLAMLEGAIPNSAIAQLRNMLQAYDNGTRGHLQTDGQFERYCMLGFTGRYFFFSDWFMEVDLPIYHTQLGAITLQDQTVQKTAADIRVKNYLTNNFTTLVKTLGEGLDITGGWKRTGCGDCTVLINWFRDFPQRKVILKNARVNWRLGAALPTGLKEDIDLVLAGPYGNDGAFGLPFGVGLDLDLVGHLRFGLDVQLTHLFGNTRTRRIKTNIGQSEIVLLATAPAYKDFGLIQRLNMYVGAYQIAHCFSLIVGYQYWKKDRDQLTVCSNDYSTLIANTARSLEEKTWHQIIINAQYDGAYHFSDHCIRPYVSLFGRIPFNGKNTLLNHTVGFVCAIDF